MPDDTVSLREYLEARMAAMNAARDLAAHEYERRLDALNGEQARLAADRERFVTREAYELQQREFGHWRDTVNAALSLGAGRDRGVALSWAVLVGAVAVTATLVTLLVKFL